MTSNGPVFQAPPTAGVASGAVDSTPATTVASNGAAMQPAAAYNYSGIPMGFRRPVNYINPISKKEEVE